MKAGAGEFQDIFDVGILAYLIRRPGTRFAECGFAFYSRSCDIFALFSERRTFTTLNLRA